MYSIKSRVRYSEINEDQTLGMPAIVDYFQDCSTFQSEDLGLGIEYLKEENRCWLLSSWQVNVNRYPSLGESITIGTWAYKFQGFYGYRNFVMLDEKNEKIAYANSIWINYDTETKRPVKISSNQIAEYQMEEKLDMDYADRKIILPEVGIRFPEFPVRKYHIDTNQHVNNGQYIKIAKEFIPDGFEFNQMRAEYKKSAQYNESMIPIVSDEGNVIKVALSGADNKPYALVEFARK